MKTNKVKKPSTLLLVLIAVILSASYMVFKSIAKPAQIAEISPEKPEVVTFTPENVIPLVYGGSPTPRSSSTPASSLPSTSPVPSNSAVSEEPIVPETPEVIVLPAESAAPLAVNTNARFLPGDLNQDHQVGLADYNLLVSKFGNPYTLADYNNLVKNYGKTN